MTIDEIKEKYATDNALVSRRSGNLTGVANKYKTEENIKKSQKRAGEKFDSEKAWFKNTESELVGGLKGLQGLVNSSNFANENAGYTSSSALKSAVKEASNSLKATIEKYRRAIKLAQMGIKRS